MSFLDAVGSRLTRQGVQHAAYSSPSRSPRAITPRPRNDLPRDARQDTPAVQTDPDTGSGRGGEANVPIYTKRPAGGVSLRCRSDDTRPGHVEFQGDCRENHRAAAGTQREQAADVSVGGPGTGKGGSRSQVK